MSQPLRVRICRAAFVLLCLLPTLTFIGWIGRASTVVDHSNDKALWEDELSRILGLRVTVERVEQMELGRTLLHGVEIADPEGGLLARVHAIELARTDEGLAIAAEHPEVQAGRLGRLWETLDGVLRTRGPRDLAIHFTANSLTLHESPGASSAGRAITLADVSTWIRESEAGPSLEATFRRAATAENSEANAEPMQFNVVRCCRLSDERTTKWRIDTTRSSLPCWPLAGAVPELSQLGSDCEFAGRFTCEHTSRGWQAEADAALYRVDLDRLVTRPFGLGLSGHADVRLAALRVQDGRVEAASGEVHASGGELSRSLLHAAESYLPVVLSQEMSAAGAEGRRYENLRFEFDLLVDRITWRGLCDSPGFVFATDVEGRPLVELMPLDVTERPQRETTAALFEALALDASSPGAVALLEWLRFPQAAPLGSSEGRPRVRIRPFGR